MYAHLCACADEERTDVECSTCLVWWDETLVQTHHLVHHLVELLSGEFRHEDATASALQTGCILVRTEHTHLAIWAAVCLQSLECLLAIVQTSGCHVEWYSLFGANLDFAPFAVTVVTAYIVISLAVAETEVRPIHLFHIL